MTKVLIKTLEKFNIKFDIKRFVYFFNIYIYIFTNFHFSITRDNASSNDSLMSSFIRAYDIEGFKFQGDIASCAHVLNIVI